MFFLGCFIGKIGSKADSATVQIIVDLPIHKIQNDLHKWLGLANYVHYYSADYAYMARPLFTLLKKNME